MNQLRAQGHGMECWMDDRGLWTWGFTDKFAVYDNQTWQYESDQKNGDNRTLVLRNGDERLRADFQLTNDTTCTIAVEGGKPQIYRRWDSHKGIFAYLPTDNTPPAPCTRQTLRGTPLSAPRLPPAGRTRAPAARVFPQLHTKNRIFYANFPAA